MLTKVEQAFQEAVCTETMPAGQSIVCGCGQVYMDTCNPTYYGQFQGMIVVAGCECPSSSSFAGFLWGHRHQVAKFFRVMLGKLEDDMVELRGELPAELGKEEA